MRLQMKLVTELLSDAALEQIFQSAVRILRQVPFRIQGTPELMDLLNTFGCQIDGERVKMPGTVIDTVVDRIREQKRLNASSDAEDWRPGNEVTMSSHGQAILACDLETNQLRPATKRDLETWCHVVDALRDVTLDAAHIDEETIIDVAQRGAYYMDTDHTARFFREAMWLPQFNDYRVAGAWQGDPSDIIERARDQARQMVETAENQCPLSDDQRAEIQWLLDAANREAAGSLTR